MEIIKSKVYVMADELSRITRCEGGYTTPSDLTGWTQIDEGTGDKYNLCQSHYFDGGLYTEDGIPRYKLEDGKPVERTAEEMEADRAAIPPARPSRTSQMEAAVMAFAAAAVDIEDTVALQMPDLFPTWEDVLAAGKELPAGRILQDGTQLYRVVQAVTPQDGQPPHGDGMLAVYRPIDHQHAGTTEDPIPWVSGMDCFAGKHYYYNGKVYRVAVGGSMTPCVWPPDTPDMWQWEAVE